MSSRSSTESLTVHAYQWDILDGKDDEPLRIHAWCLDRESNPYLLRIEDFPTSCYIELPSTHRWNGDTVAKYVKWLNFVLGEDKPLNVKYQPCSKLYYYKGHEVKFPMLHATFATLKAMNHCEKLLAKPRTVWELGEVRVRVWETSISVVRKLLTIRNCGFSQWFTASGIKMDEDCSISTLPREYKVDWTTLKSLDGTTTKGWVAHPRVLSFDIETYSHNHKAFPNSLHSKHVVYMISAIYQRLGLPETRKRYGIIMGACGDIPENFAQLIQVKTEKELIAAFAQLVQDLDPEILCGYNIFGFDYHYLDDRLTRVDNHWDKLPSMSRLKGDSARLYTKIWKSSGYGINKIDILQMAGRISIDMLPLIKRDYKLDKYDLDFVSKMFLGKGKHDIKAAAMFKIYEGNQDWLASGSSDTKDPRYTRMSEVMRYCLQDAELVIDLMDKLNIWIALVEMSNIVGVSVMDLFTRGQQIRCLSQLYDLAARLGIVLDQRPASKVHFSGGFVYEPIPGLYQNVICLDFASLYPSVMMAYNICYSSLVPPELEDEIPDSLCNVIEFDQEEEDEDEEDDEDEEQLGKTKKKKSPTVIKHYRYKFVRGDVHEGLLPRLVKRLVQERRALRKQLDGVKDNSTNEWIIPPEKDPTTRTILDKRQLALKVSANSMFGFLGVRNGGKLPLLEGARCITALGRQLIGKVNAYLKEKYQARIVYNDTDSSMVDLGLTDRKEATKWGIRLAQEISGVKKGQILWDGSVAEEDQPGLFPPPLAMEFEKAMLLLALKKKKYCALLVGKDGEYQKDRETGKLTILKRGVVLARRDNCKYLRRIYEKLLIEILQLQPVTTAMDTIVDAVADLAEGKVDWQELVVIREMGAYGPDSTYFMKTFSEELRRVGKPSNPGDRIEYLVADIPGVEKVGLKLKSVEMYLEEPEPPKLDYSYYINKQLMNPLEQLIQVAYQDVFKKLPSDLGYKPNSRCHFVPISQPIKLMLAMLKDRQDIRILKPWFRAQLD